MNRSPYLLPLGRAADMDVGGAADLQTDIMRFMAILALCLVAIFALVQSIPLEPVESVSRPVAETRIAQRDEPIAVPTPEPKIDPAPLMAPLTPPPAREPIAATPKPTPAAASSAPTPEPKIDPAPLPEPEGFTLRFASDSALTRLVARNDIGLYAITPDRALRMSMNRGAPSFWPASAPNQYHEMDPATVPDQVITALRRAGTLGLDPQVKWGVTLPAGMRRQLDTYLSEHSGGELVIEPSGKLRLEG
jgi:hypothetical protein